MIEYSGQTDNVGKDLNEHIVNLSILAKTPAFECTGLELLSKSNKIVLSNECTHVPFSFKATRKKQEKQEHKAMRKRTMTEERTENIRSPQGKQHKTLSFHNHLYRLPPRCGG